MTIHLLAQQTNHFSLCVKKIKLQAGERIVAFDLKFKGAIFESLPKIPLGWTYKISNLSSGFTSLEAGAITTSAGLESTSLDCLASMERITFNEKVTAELIIYVVKGDEEPRPIKVNKSLLVFKNI
jgi:hypothetical protein